MKKTIIISLLSVCVSCATYEMSPVSLKNQLENSSMVEKKISLNALPIFFNSSYNALQLDSLEVFDKKGNKIYLHNSPSIEICVIDFKGEKFTMYFDTVVIENDTLIGSRSQFMPNIKHRVPFNTLSKIFI
ncbi:hypothetical protein [Myroides indicus]|uniref:Uncharacterized protein n=1 Tax=Myroides indicus TaxID=1323422 RepID=A0A4R7F7W8_9FLAO|nr:hypothetical protein [Myroides indicus]TDS64991.1 hypothetical protein C8P70_10311 [Myroides indicus]